MPDEPLLRGNEIQGDSLAGFRKDHVTLLFLRFNPKKIAEVKTWLRALTPRLATLNAVAQFNDSFRLARRSLPRLPGAIRPPDPPLAATWMNIAFTSNGLTKLLGNPAAISTFETAFRLGAAQRAGAIGDPTGGEPGSPSTWLVGAGRKVPDAMLNLASDNETMLAQLTKAMRAEIKATGAIQIIHLDTGNAKLAPAVGHEHFGFKDGVSQPGVRGQLDTPTRPFLTPRLIAASDPLGETFASPGVPLIQPGEFVLGYPRQNPDRAVESQPERNTRTEPAWARDGSYLVYRRLRQDVAAFERFLDHGASALAAQGFTGIDREHFGAMCVGRWKDGTPMARSPLAPHSGIAADRRAAQSFFFAKDTRPVAFADGRPPDTFPAAVMDGDGQRCPLPGHVRKVNPRDEGTDVGQGARTLRRRILRRGVTFGPSWTSKPNAERGLLFLCYQASITDQFEFVWRAWANATNTPRADGGIDPIIGQNGNAPPDERVAHFVQGDRAAKVESAERFVISTGGAYLFAPSISAIRDVLCV